MSDAKVLDEATIREIVEWRIQRAMDAGRGVRITAAELVAMFPEPEPDRLSDYLELWNVEDRDRVRHAHMADHPGGFCLVCGNLAPHPMHDLRAAPPSGGGERAPFASPVRVVQNDRAPSSWDIVSADGLTVGWTLPKDRAEYIAAAINAYALSSARSPQAPVDVVAAVRRGPTGTVWLARRNAKGAHGGLAGMWEYPGGKVEPHEQLRDALVRELREEFPGCEPKIGAVLDSIESTLTGTGTGDDVLRTRTYRVTFFAVEMDDPTEHPTHSEVRWMTPAEACSVDHLPSGTIFNARHLARSPQEGPREDEYYCPSCACQSCYERSRERRRE